MNCDVTRKRRERHLLERFLAALAVNPDAIDETEAPDFLLRIDNKVVGVEVTEIFRESDGSRPSPRARENITDRIVARARTLYQERRGKLVHVNVLFLDGVNVEELNREAVAARLAELVHSLPLGTNHVRWRNNYEDRTLDSIAFVSALAVPDVRMSHWGVARAGWRAQLSMQSLRSAIESKNEKVHGYRTKAEEVWLLLAVEGSRPSQFFDPEVPPASSSLNSKFDRTYWFNAMHDQLVCWPSSDA